jgi:hypothetical protein
MKVTVNKIKKFDVVELISGSHTVDYVLMYKESKMCRIFYMNGRSTFCLTNEEIEVKRDKFYSVNHKIFTTSILNVYQ